METSTDTDSDHVSLYGDIIVRRVLHLAAYYYYGRAVLINCIEYGRREETVRRYTPPCSYTTLVCCWLTLCGSSAQKWPLPPMVLATLSHRACNYIFLVGFCHIVPPGKFYHENLS